MFAPLSTLLAAGAALGAVLALIWIAARLAQRLGLAPRVPRAAGTAASGLALEASLALDPRRRVHLLRLGERRVLLLTGGTQDRLLGWLPGPERPPSPDGAP